MSWAYYYYGSPRGLALSYIYDLDAVTQRPSPPNNFFKNSNSRHPKIIKISFFFGLSNYRVLFNIDYLAFAIEQSFNRHIL